MAADDFDPDAFLASRRAAKKPAAAKAEGAFDPDAFLREYKASKQVAPSAPAIPAEPRPIRAVFTDVKDKDGNKRTSVEINARTFENASRIRTEIHIVATVGLFYLYGKVECEPDPHRN